MNRNVDALTPPAEPIVDNVYWYLETELTPAISILPALIHCETHIILVDSRHQTSPHPSSSSSPFIKRLDCFISSASLMCISIT